MLSTWQISRLIEPVVWRAQATFEERRSGFADRAARFVLGQLGCDELISPTGLWRQRRLMLERCRWIDDTVMRFFLSHPLGEGIEVEGGLSTRFHRISERLDWPRFSWRAINTLDISDCLQFVFPQLDNFTSIASDSPNTHWFRHIYWRSPNPKIVILAEDRPLKNWQEFIQLTSAIQAELTEETPTIEVILSHTLEELPQKIDAAISNVSVAESMPQSIRKPSFWSELNFSPFRIKNVPTIYVHRLVFSREAADSIM